MKHRGQDGQQAGQQRKISSKNKDLPIVWTCIRAGRTPRNVCPFYLWPCRHVLSWYMCGSIVALPVPSLSRYVCRWSTHLYFSSACPRAVLTCSNGRTACMCKCTCSLAQRLVAHASTPFDLYVAELPHSTRRGRRELPKRSGRNGWEESTSVDDSSSACTAGMRTGRISLPSPNR